MHNASAFSPSPTTPKRAPRPYYHDDVMESPNAGLGPILCVCFTNHALDQFLEGLLAAGIEKVMEGSTHLNQTKAQVQGHV